MAQFPVFDAHSDIPSKVIEEQDPDNPSVIRDEFLDEMEENNIKARVAAVYVDEEYLPSMAAKRAFTMIEGMHREANATDGVEIATTVDEIRENAEQGIHSFLLGMEGAEPLQHDVDMLDVYYRLGVRVLGLTHARRNFVAEGVPLWEPDTEGVTGGGLTHDGVKLVNKMDDLGVVIDTAHLNRKSFWDVIEHTNNPIINSHSNAASVYDTRRNLTDDQIIAIADTGGVVSATPLILTLAPDQPELSDVIDQITHIVDLVGVDHVGIGLDYFEYLLEYLDDGHTHEFTSVEGLWDDSEVKNLPNGLLEHGYTEDEVRKILWDNNLRTIDAVIS